MIVTQRPAAVAAVLVTCVFVLSGCAKVQLFGDPAGVSLTRPQAELRAIAERLEETPWPDPKQESMASNIASILLGGMQDKQTREAGGLTRETAAQSYLEAKIDANRNSDIRVAVMDDARRTLETAAELTVAADAIIATASARYLNEDVAVLEKAISDLRGHRAMYEVIFTEMDRRGVGLTPLVREDLLTAFSTTARDVGAAADRLLQESRDRVAVG